MTALLEHANITVSDPEATAAWLCEVFDWQIRWRGDAISGGFTIHVGSEDRYLAIYNPNKPTKSADSSYTLTGGLNHVGIVVADLDATEALVKARGFKTHSHADYEPGRRFYFHDNDDIEFEIVSYD